MEKNKVYIKYSNKYPYLPEAVGLNVKDLADRLGKSYNTVMSAISRKQSTYAAVIIDDEEDE